ncbi:MAG: adenine phosphoribosyltransferase [Armatimonadetes bacterium]|nr:adenine phosphoribosyltransferase [Armatimonadota bacterium]
MNLKEKIRDIPDFPEKGIIFRDITTLLKDPLAYKYVIDQFTEYYQNKKIEVVVAVEARGYIFGAPLAYNLGACFVPVRKQGKLPHHTYALEYELEYGNNVIEIHRDAIREGQRVLIVDDLIATGGSSCAAAQLVEKLGGKIVGLAFMIELTFLKGRENLNGHEIFTLIQY